MGNQALDKKKKKNSVLQNRIREKAVLQNSSTCPCIKTPESFAPVIQYKLNVHEIGGKKRMNLSLR